MRTLCGHCVRWISHGEQERGVVRLQFHGEPTAWYLCDTCRLELIDWLNVAEETEGQDRESYTDDQDRESYTV